MSGHLFFSGKVECVHMGSGDFFCGYRDPGGGRLPRLLFGVKMFLAVQVDNAFFYQRMTPRHFHCAPKVSRFCEMWKCTDKQKLGFAKERVVWDCAVLPSIELYF